MSENSSDDHRKKAAVAFLAGLGAGAGVGATIVGALRQEGSFSAQAFFVVCSALAGGAGAAFIVTFHDGKGSDWWGASLAACLLFALIAGATILRMDEPDADAASQATTVPSTVPASSSTSTTISTSTLPDEPGECTASQGRIAFVSRREDPEANQPDDIWTVTFPLPPSSDADPNEFDYNNLTNSPDWREGDPSWSTNQLIAYQSNRDSSDRVAASDYDIWIMNEDGSNKQQLTANSGLDEDPEWSRDAKLIAYSSQPVGAESDVYVMNADGTGATPRVEDPLRAEGDPTWNPTGTEIAFRSETDGLGEIRIVDLVTNRIRPLFPTAATDDDDPAWSPDGRSIAAAIDGRIEVIDVDGSRSQRISQGVTSDDPAWSHDGCWLAWVSEDASGNSEVWVSGPAGENPMNISNHESFDDDPTWDPVVDTAP